MLPTGLAATGGDTSKDPSSLTPLGARQSSWVHDTGSTDPMELIERLSEMVECTLEELATVVNIIFGEQRTHLLPPYLVWFSEHWSVNSQRLYFPPASAFLSLP